MNGGAEVTASISKFSRIDLDPTLEKALSYTAISVLILAYLLGFSRKGTVDFRVLQLFCPRAKEE